MSCFPYPRDTDVESIRVPLIARTQYSITGQTNFSDFFKRTLDAETQKMDAAESDGQESTSLPLSHSLASTIQSWLFFGLASEALGRNIRHEEFAGADPDGPHPSIDLRIPEWYWRELKARWDELDDSLTAAEFDAKRTQLKKIYESAQILVIYMDLLANVLDDDKLTEILLSIHMLLYLVASVLDSNTLKVTQTTTSSASTKLLKRRMVKNGWCEKRLNFLDASPMFYPAFYFLSSLKPPRINAEDHSSCSSDRCLVTSKLSKPLHRTDECLCEDVVVPVDKVNTIVASGGIPLARITRSPLGKTELEVVPYTPSSRFIAISHVWGDQQFGSSQNCLPKCQVGYLEEVLSSLPTSMDHWGLREWVANWRSSRPGEIAPPSRAYEYFWLDSFCIPQAVEHAGLRSKAIESMNLIYAAASHTFVFDKGLQTLDAGRRPASLAHGGRPTYYSPQDENLLDVVAYIYASNWMGRAWTLQEGILSRHIVFPLHGSLAYLKLLWPHFDDGFGDFWEYLVTTIPKDLRRSARELLPRRSKPKTGVSKRLQDESEPFRESVRHQLLTHVKNSLHVEEYNDYARTPADRAARFVKAHSLLQSRTTTQAEDIPLILMNMSCMNANAISQSKTIDARMKQLFYGLESLPTELLFSDCARLGPGTVDAWIPREIVPESFEGKHTLKLGSAGFTFETRKGAQALKFFLLSSTHRSDRFRLLLPDQKDEKSLKYNVEALQRSNDEQPAAPTSVLCIVVDNEPPERGARFIVNRVVGNKYFLHFDCPLRLTEIDDSKSPSDAQQDPKHECGAVSLNGDFIIERSYEPQDLSISRPQNPEQYSDRLIVIGQAICGTINLGERYLIRAIWGDENSMSTLFYIFYGLYSFKKHQWVERALNAFVHRAWMATYQPDWDPNGPWKWFWKLSNWEPPIPFRTLMKWWCSLVFFLSFETESWSGVGIVTLYWLPLFPKQELMNMYVTAMFSKIVLSFFF
ncbi:HET domain-containing protein [Fusarium keratoplasticum]|uniref:HET domain-containing protein n=1 Tax=Fusarium keratoplasticum TaxID=1328300 RepID=A0ACC0QCI1_9HYPO|nr:HET domain-containing protein [Fusarium keratoplasticum]KAI8649100.1 HET domain-containing protein [Fusarium keratoplasticum]KAI8649499.1 HET domain-containing protein [Fusarium keratoplasticum]